MLPVPSEGPHGLWLDRGRLFCAADGGALVVLDRDSGAVLGSLPLPGVPYGTYRDHLRAGVNKVVAALWERELRFG